MTDVEITEAVDWLTIYFDTRVQGATGEDFLQAYLEGRYSESDILCMYYQFLRDVG